MSDRTELKEALYMRLIDVVKNGVETATETGVVRVTASAPYLQAAIALLKVDEETGTPLPKNTSEVLNRLHKARPGQQAAAH